MTILTITSDLEENKTRRKIWNTRKTKKRNLKDKEDKNEGSGRKQDKEDKYKRYRRKRYKEDEKERPRIKLDREEENERPRRKRNELEKNNDDDVRDQTGECQQQ